MQELDDLLKGDDKPEIETQPPALKEENKQDDEVSKKKRELENLERAKQEARAELKRIREEKRVIKGEEEEIPKIDFSDPSSKAWDKHIRENVNPLQQELEKEKDEIRTFAFQEFLQDKPALSADPEKIKELMSTYDRIKTASERTKEGVLMDLNRAFAAVYSEELISRARENRIDKVRSDMLFSNPAISRGASSMQAQKDSVPADSLTPEERVAVIRMYGSLEEYNESAKKNV